MPNRTTRLTSVELCRERPDKTVGILRGLALKSKQVGSLFTELALPAPTPSPPLPIWTKSSTKYTKNRQPTTKLCWRRLASAPAPCGRREKLDALKKLTRQEELLGRPPLVGY